MKKLLVVWVVILGLVLSGCSKVTSKSTENSPQNSEQNKKTTETELPSSEQKTKPTEKTPLSKSSSSSKVTQASENITGVWMAKGKQDGVTSSWSFNNGQLTVNYVYHFSYVIAKNKGGYIVVTIRNSKGKNQHALLLKRMAVILKV
ncbi:hypothetical protein SAMN04488137_1597 [Fictibacillus solisalsi]|uniref:Uncharacterized protein n=1 Tax=Fictibacillus solisalsi TaxID=459525 RepID=A0A1G9VI03_9BACL|nr:hypothetical protein [Fictibacillus solisalsi]SDM71740.1 hypothetical protein SAMN04488137_1597 [Fictibacillus solisalsi]